jgi:hypothetical protein
MQVLFGVDGRNKHARRAAQQFGMCDVDRAIGDEFDTGRSKHVAIPANRGTGIFTGYIRDVFVHGDPL